MKPSTVQAPRERLLKAPGPPRRRDLTREEFKLHRELARSMRKTAILARALARRPAVTTDFVPSGPKQAADLEAFAAELLATADRFDPRARP
jgi:hypothetical protein